MKKNCFFLSVAICLWMCSFAQAEVIDRIVATVDDDPITLYDVRTFGKAPGQQGQQAMFMPQGGAAGMSDKDILEVLIMNKLIMKEVETQGIKAKDEDVDSYIERIKAQGNLNDEQFKAALAAQGMTYEGYRQQVAGEIERALLVNKEIATRVNVTPQDIERYYKENSKDYSEAEQVHVRHIFLPLTSSESYKDDKEVMAKAEEIRKRAMAGEDFGKLADEFSQGPGAGQGGDLGYFKKGQMAKEIDDVAFSLQPGEVSQPFRSGAGIHLIKVEERIEPGQLALSKEATEEIKRKLYNEALKERYDRWFQEDLRFRHNIENFLTTASHSSTSRLLTKSSDVHPAETETQEKGEKEGFFENLWPF